MCDIIFIPPKFVDITIYNNSEGNRPLILYKMYTFYFERTLKQTGKGKCIVVQKNVQHM